MEFIFISILLMLNVLVSFILVTTKKHLRLNKVFVFIFIWLVPIIGSVGALMALWMHDHKSYDDDQPWYGDDGPL